MMRSRSTVKYSSIYKANRYQTTDKTWLYSIAQQGEIKPHRFDRKTSHNIWYLMPGVYFTLVLHEQTWNIYLLRINRDGTHSHEEPYFVPHWTFEEMPNEARDAIAAAQGTY